MGVLISTHIADASAATILPEEQFQKINSPKDQLKKLTNLVLLLLNVYYIERRERGKSNYPKTYNNTCLILFPLGSKIGGRVSSIFFFFLLSNSRVSVGNIQLCRIGIDELVPPLKKKIVI